MGVLLKPFIESFFDGRLDVVGVCLLVTAALLCFAYFSAHGHWRPTA